MNEQKNNSRVVKKMAASSEKPAGEWNTMEVTCKSNTIEVTVNGFCRIKPPGSHKVKGTFAPERREGHRIQKCFHNKTSQAARK